MRKKNNDDGYQYYQEITMSGLIDKETKDIVEAKKAELKQKKKSEPKPLETYSYSGPVKRFGKVVISNFNAETTAVSEKQAINNIIFQAKKEMHLVPYAGGFALVNKVYKIS